MRKILGLDIGVTSVGWALVKENEGEIELIDIGSRIIPLTTDENNEFTKGNAISKNAERTLKRGVRRNLHRFRMRKHKLANFLKINEMNPSEEMFKLDSLALYGLRVKAITEQISLAELGRILYHLNQKRGYLSNRKAQNEEEAIPENEEKTSKAGKVKKKGYLELIQEREDLLDSENQTVGQYFYQKISQNPLFRVKENIFFRKRYIHEFDEIWVFQQKFYPAVLTDEAYLEVRNEIIYFQRPLKSQKHLVSGCQFEWNYAFDKSGNKLLDKNNKPIIKRPKVAPKSSPIFQVSKIWQDLNNLRIAHKNGDIVDITLADKQPLFELLDVDDKLSQKQILDALDLKPSKNFYTNLRLEKQWIEGNRTKCALLKAFRKLNIEKNDCLRFDLFRDTTEKVNTETGEVFTKEIITSSFEQEPLFQLWHLLYSVEETESILGILTKKYDFTLEQAKEISKIDFHKSGYGSLSTRAIRKILPSLQDGKMYAHACDSAGFRHSDYMTNDENNERTVDEKLELYKKNSLRNPVVEKIVNQVINLVNEIITNPEYLTFEERNNKDSFEIRVELGRELRQSMEERNKTFSRNQKQEKRHKAIEEIIQKEVGINRVSKRDIEKYKLWEEFGQMSPYEPNKIIKITELFSKNNSGKNQYEIEHIIPKSRLFDDSFANKTICSRALNAGTEGKNDRTGFDFMEARGKQSLHDYVEFVKGNFYKKDGISRAKLSNLLMPQKDIPQDFINRQLQETRYIVREVSTLLNKVCKNVTATSGALTAHLRHVWGFDRILQDLNIDRYPEERIIEVQANGKTERRIKDWTKREDHRHHAVDALTVALTTDAIVLKMNTLNAKQQSFDSIEKELANLYKSRNPHLHTLAEDAIANILVSFKAGQKVATWNTNIVKRGKEIFKKMPQLTPRGFLHKESVHGKIRSTEKIKLSPKFDSFETIVSPKIKEELLARLISFGNDPKKAFKDSEKNPLPEHLKEFRIYQDVTVLRYQLNESFKAADTKSIVDEGIKKIVKARLAEFGDDPKKAFQNLKENPIWFNQEKNLEIKAVRCFTKVETRPLHTNEKGERIDFVQTRNNHNVAVYEDENGKLQENVVTLWDAFERKAKNLPVVVRKPEEVWQKILNEGSDNQKVMDKLPMDSWRYLTSMQRNEMFVIGLDLAELQEAVLQNNYKKISPFLYRVQSISSKDYWFRHHLETKLLDTAEDAAVGKFIRFKSLGRVNSIIKVKINTLGKIVKIGEDD
jgi:CRISPR-associated endonuclease Csn1